MAKLTIMLVAVTTILLSLSSDRISEGGTIASNEEGDFNKGDDVIYDSIMHFTPYFLSVTLQEQITNNETSNYNYDSLFKNVLKYTEFLPNEIRLIRENSIQGVEARRVWDSQIQRHKRVVFYNPNFLAKMKAGTYGNYQVCFVFAHEIGHFIYSFGEYEFPYRKELVADNYAGHVLRLMKRDNPKISQEVYIETLKYICSSPYYDKENYPKETERINSAKQGWLKGQALEDDYYKKFDQEQIASQIFSEDSKLKNLFRKYKSQSEYVDFYMERFQELYLNSLATFGLTEESDQLFSPTFEDIYEYGNADSTVSINGNVICIYSDTIILNDTLNSVIQNTLFKSSFSVGDSIYYIDNKGFIWRDSSGLLIRRGYLQKL